MKNDAVSLEYHDFKKSLKWWIVYDWKMTSVLLAITKGREHTDVLVTFYTYGNHVIE